MMHRLIASLRNLLHGRQADSDLNAEIDSHLQLLTDEYVANGMPLEMASRQVVLDIGGAEQVRNQVREARTGIFFEQVWQDLRYGWRNLCKSPGFALLAVFTLALGIGANTAMFSVIDGVLLQKPPFAEPLRVTVAWQKQPNGNNNVFSTPAYLEWKRQSGPLAQMAAVVGEGHTLGTREPVERITGWKASAEVFSVLGVSPAIGRRFTAEEDRPGADKVVLLSDTLWKTRFQADRNILSSKIDLDGAPYTVIGVMPAGFHMFSDAEQFFEPLRLQTQDAAASSRTVHWILGLVRLAQGGTLKQSQSAVDTIAARLHHDNPNADAGFGVQLQGYQDVITSGVRTPLLLLMGSVGFVLLIACSNVANLLLARGTARRQEMSIRAAVGAQRSRVVRQLLTESLLLCSAGRRSGTGSGRGRIAHVGGYESLQHSPC
jgi:predicted permease